jgi:hypothetical protein
MNAGQFRSSAAGRLELVTWEVIRMKAILSARSRSYRGAPRPVLYALLVLVSMGASATAQSGGPLVQQLDSIAGADVLENRASASSPPSPRARTRCSSRRTARPTSKEASR